MFMNLANKYRWLAINASFITCTYLKRKFQILLCQEKEANSGNNNSSMPFSKYTFTTLNRDNKNLDPENKNRKIDPKIIQMINEYREAALYEDYSDLFNFSDEIVSEKEKEKISGEIDFTQNFNIKKKKFEEESFVIGNENTILNRSFIQVDIDKLMKIKSGELKVNKDTNNNEDYDLHIEDPQRYFQKVMVFRINDQYYATSSFCGYDLTDLKTAVLLGNKLVCPNCLSEYNIENGFTESGPNTRNLATFPVSFRKGKLLLKIPKERIPLFSVGPIADVANELDPRHFVVIGDNETAYACVDTLTKTFTGKISIISHQTGNDFIDRNKLLKSFFPLKVRHAKFINKDYLDTFKINFYDEKVASIDGIKRLVNLSSGNKIPFDKVMIAVGSHKVGLKANHKNAFKLETIKDHAAIHNAIIKPEVKSVALIGNSLQILETASSMRRYLDAIDKKDTKIYIITENDRLFLNKLGVGDPLIKMITNYLARNNIYLFRSSQDLNFEEDKAQNVIKKAEIVSDKLVFKLPADLFIFDSPILISNLDFINKIVIKKTLTEDSFKMLYGNLIIPDERFSLHQGDQYAHIFTAGSCSSFKSGITNHMIRTDNVKANFHLGYIGALNMLEVHYPFDDIVVNSAKVLDKNLYIMGDDPVSSFDKIVTYVDPEKEQFIIYLFKVNRVSQIIMYGFDRFQVYLREAMRMRMTPPFDYINRYRDTAHLRIVQEMVKNQDKVECFKHKAFKLTGSIDTNKYSVEDQAYAEDITRRAMTAYNVFKEKVDEEYSKKQDEKLKKELQKQKEIEKQLRKEKEAV